MADRAADKEYARRLRDHARSIEDVWIGLYGQQPELQVYAADFATAIETLMDAKYPELKDATLRDLMPYTNDDDLKIRAMANFLVTGQNSPGTAIRPRHAVSAARIATTTLLQSKEGALKLDTIDRQTNELVDKNRPPGLLGVDPAARAAVVRRFVDTVDVDRVLGPES